MPRQNRGQDRRTNHRLPLEPLEQRLLFSGNLEGMVYADLDANGWYQVGDQGIPAVTVYLDTNNNGQLDWTDGNGNGSGSGVWNPGEGEQWTTTDANGNYQFIGLAAGEYTVRNLQIPGFVAPQLSTQILIEPDDFAPGADLNYPVEDVRLAFEGTQDIVRSVQEPNAPTGDYVFGVDNGDPQWWDSVGKLRGDTYQLVERVSYDFTLVSAESSYVYLAGYDRAGQQVEGSLVSVSGVGSVVSDSIDSFTGRIATFKIYPYDGGYIDNIVLTTKDDGKVTTVSDGTTRVNVRLGNRRRPDMPDIPDGDDTGASNTDNLISKGTDPVTNPLSITVNNVQAGDIVHLYKQDESAPGLSFIELATATATGNSVTFSSIPAMPAGRNALFAATEDGYGLWYMSTPLVFDIDAVPPDVGVNKLTTVDPSPQITGTVGGEGLYGLVVRIEGIDYTPTIAPDGTWSIPAGTLPALAPGTYQVQATAMDVAGNTTVDSTVDDLVILTTNSSIAGTIWLDRNSDAVRDADEPVLPGVTVYLDDNDNGQLEWADGNGNSLWDPGEGERWMATDAGGAYLFTGLAPGVHAVRNFGPPGYAQTQPSDSDDPLVSQLVRQPEPRSSDTFGNDVVIMGDQAFVGAYYDDEGTINGGAVHVFDIVDGELQFAQSLADTDLDWDYDVNLFGHRLAGDGVRLMVGSYARDFVAQNATEGAAYIYTQVAGQWSLEQMLTASDMAPDARFGSAIAIRGDLAVVAADYGSTVNGMNAAVYFFKRINGVWTEQQKLSSPNSSFGWQVEITESRQALVYDNGQYLIYRETDGTWALDGALPVSGGHTYGNFEVDGDSVVAVRSDRYVVVLEWDGSAWLQTAEIYHPENLPNDWSGAQVSLSGDMLAVRARYDDTAGTDAGAVFIFRESVLGGWDYTRKLTAPGSDSDDAFGSSIDVDGLRVLAGMPGADYPGMSNAGGAYFFSNVGPIGAHNVQLAAAQDIAGIDFGKTHPTTTIDLDSASDTYWNNDDLTSRNNASPANALTFKLDTVLAGDNVELYADNGVDPPLLIGSAVAGQDGVLALVTDGSTTLADGAYSITAVITDALGTWFSSGALTVTIDTVGAAATVDTLLTLDRTPGMTGTIDDPDAQISLSLNGTYFYAVTNNGDGTWTLPDNRLPTLSLGEYDVTLRTTDRAGNVLITTFPGVLTIATLPYFNISDAQVIEGDAGTTQMVFTVTPTRALYDTSIVDWSVPPAGDATPGVDFDDTTTSGTLTWLAGESHSQTIAFDVFGDDIEELDETFRVRLDRDPDNPIGFWQLGDYIGVGTIIDDDPVPGLDIADASVTEGDTGVTQMTFTVTPDEAFVDTSTVSWYVSATGNATPGVDYDGGAAGTLVWLEGESHAQTLTVDIYTDTTYEPYETFSVVLYRDPTLGTGTWELNDATAVGAIVNDDDPPIVSISDAQVVEGDSGTTPLVFTVGPDIPFIDDVRVDWRVVQGSATAGVDYDEAMSSGSLYWLAGESDAKTFSIDVFGDTSVEPDESILVYLFRDIKNEEDPPGTWSYDRQQRAGYGTILNDDFIPAVSIGDTQVIEGNSGTTQMVFDVTPDIAFNDTSRIDWRLVVDGATPGTDFDDSVTTGSFTWLAGESDTRQVVIDVFGDIEIEGDEPFYIQLYRDETLGTGTWSFGDSFAQGTILNDDVLVDGDTDYNGKVNFADFVTLSNNYGATGKTWSDGDFTGDGVVAFEDFVLLSNNYGYDATPTSTAPVAASAESPPDSFAAELTSDDVEQHASFDFGSVGLGERQARSFTIRNTGERDLIVPGTFRFAPGSPFFVTPANRPSKGTDDWLIPVGDRLTFVVSFKPGVRGTLVDDLYLSGNDPLQPTYTMTFTGTGV